MSDKKSKLDHVIFIFFVVGLCALAFAAGAVVLNYDLPFSKTFKNAFIAADAWFDPTLKESPASDQIPDDVFLRAQTTWDKKLAYEGYTLVTTGFSTSVYLVDMEGKIVYQWNIPIEKVWPNPERGPTDANGIAAIAFAHLFSNGNLLVQFGAWGDKPYGYGIAKIDKNANVLWSYHTSVHHALTIDQNDNIYLLEQETILDPVPEFKGLLYPLIADYIIKLSPDGKELDKISILDSFYQSPFELMMYHGAEDGDSKWDFFHSNSIDVLGSDIADKFPLFKAGQILVSIRTIDTLAVIDPDTRKVVWAYGGRWSRQHAANFLPNGHIMVLDNQGHFEYGKRYSRVIEFNPANLRVAWYYAGSKNHPFFTDSVGRLQRLANGNTLIAESTNARIFEVTPQGKTVWNYNLPKIKRSENRMNNIFTATRYTKEQLTFLKK